MYRTRLSAWDSDSCIRDVGLLLPPSECLTLLEEGLGLVFLRAVASLVLACLSNVKYTGLELRAPETSVLYMIRKQDSTWAFKRAYPPFAAESHLYGVPKLSGCSANWIMIIGRFITGGSGGWSTTTLVAEPYTHSTIMSLTQVHFYFQIILSLVSNESVRRTVFKSLLFGIKNLWSQFWQH